MPWLAAAAGLAVLVAALVLWGFGRAAARREVVMIVAPVEAGDPITDAALGSTMVAIDSSSTQLFSASQRAELAGKIAAIDLAPGDLLGPSLISTGPSVPDGWLEIGGLLRAGRYPVSLSVGDRNHSAGRPTIRSTSRSVATGAAAVACRRCGVGGPCCGVGVVGVR